MTYIIDIPHKPLRKQLSFVIRDKMMDIYIEGIPKEVWVKLHESLNGNLTKEYANSILKSTRNGEYFLCLY
jgi:hypothetical protein